MEYVVSARVAQFDIQALTNLEVPRKQAIVPLLNLRGDNLNHINRFASQWGDYPFMFDISRFAADEDCQLILQHGLNSPEAHFASKRAMFDYVKGLNDQMIPVVGWQETDSLRDITQFLLGLDRDYGHIAIRVSLPQANAVTVLRSLLATAPDTSKISVVLDFESIARNGVPDAGPRGDVAALIQECAALGVRNIVLLSSSFPVDRPVNGTARLVPCADIVWQQQLRRHFEGLPIVYGDYGATDPNANVDFVPGMSIIPFANYYLPLEWWQKRLGRDKEFENYVTLAEEICSLASFHGEGFCWATREIVRIATTGDQYGSNGKWNAYKINQHICAQLDVLRAPAYGVVEEEDEE